jgi:hypothetical protein
MKTLAVLDVPVMNELHAKPSGSGSDSAAWQW